MRVASVLPGWCWCCTGHHAPVCRVQLRPGQQPFALVCACHGNTAGHITCVLAFSIKGMLADLSCYRSSLSIAWDSPNLQRCCAGVAPDLDVIMHATGGADSCAVGRTCRAPASYAEANRAADSTGVWTTLTPVSLAASALLFASQASTCLIPVLKPSISPCISQCFAAGSRRQT